MYCDYFDESVLTGVVCGLSSVAVECKAAFMKDSFPSDLPVVLKVFLRSFIV